MKSHAQVVMNITGAPNYVWTFCMIWISDVYNIVAHESLNYRTPYEQRHGTTPDISAYILFHFWEKIYYYDKEPRTEKITSPKTVVLLFQFSFFVLDGFT